MAHSLARDSQIDPDLARAIGLWPELPKALRCGLGRWPEIPEAIRAGILALFGAAGK